MEGEGGNLVLNAAPLATGIAQKMKFSITVFFSKFLQFSADLVIFIDEIFNGKLYFMCGEGKIHLKTQSFSTKS